MKNKTTKKIILGMLLALSLVALNFAPVNASDTNPVTSGLWRRVGNDMFTVPAGQTINVGACNGCGTTNNPFIYTAVNRHTITSLDSPYTLLSTDQILTADTSSGNISITLPLANPQVYRNIVIEKPSYSNTVIVFAQVGQFINQGISFQMVDGQTAIHLEAINTTQWIASQSIDGFSQAPLVVTAATVGILPNTPTYNNGIAGVGATLTSFTVTAFPATIDGVIVHQNDLVLVKNEVSDLTNGVYKATTITAPWQLTRATSSDQSAELDNQVVVAGAGTVNHGILYAQQTPTPTIGTDSIIYLAITAGSNFVTQQASGVQSNAQIPSWTAVSKELKRGTSDFTWNASSAILTIGNALTANHIGQINMGGTTPTARFISYNPNLVAGVGQNTAVGHLTGTITTGGNNSMFGDSAGKSMTTGLRNDFFGELAGNTITSGTDNQAFGSTALNAITSGSANVGIGTGSLLQITTALSNVGVGNTAGQSLTSGNGNTFLGTSTDVDSSVTTTMTGSTVIGFTAKATGNNQLILGGASSAANNVYIGKGVTNTTAGATTIHATGGSGTDKVGASMTLSGGVSTGAGIGGDIIFTTTPAGASGTTLNTALTATAVTIKGVDQSVRMATRFQENTGASVASASTITLGGDGNFFFITGSTTINTIATTNWQDGSEITLSFASANGPLITLAGNIVPQYGVAFQTTGITWLKLRLTGSTWYEESRSNTTNGYSSSQTSPTNPAGVTTVAGAAMMGLGSTATITPHLSGKVMITLSGDISNSVVGSSKVQIRYGTGTAPTNGAANTGTTLGGLVVDTVSVAGSSSPFSLQGVVTGLLNNGTTYWIDASLQSVGVAGVATIADLSATAVELP